MRYANFGSISHATMRTKDLIPAFADALEWLTSGGRNERSTKESELLVECDALEDFSSEDAQYLLEELFDALGEYAPPYSYFGAHPGDGSDYGFWLLEDWEEVFDGLKVDDTSEVPANYSGEVMHVSDHGNLTLYSANAGQLTEVWGLV